MRCSLCRYISGGLMRCMVCRYMRRGGELMGCKICRYMWEYMGECVGICGEY